MDLNLAAAHEAIAAAVPDREAFIGGGRRLSWSDVTDRTRRLANLFGDHGIGRRRTLAECEPWESPHDHVALYLHNGHEYLEGMLGAAKAGAAAVNVNYRYVADELRSLLDDAAARAVVFHGRFASILGAVVPRLRTPPLLVQVDDGSGADLLPGALDYEEAVAASPASRPDIEWPPDDLYVLYTGGTTGHPKGVLWRQADFIASCLGIDDDLDHLVAAAVNRRPLRLLPAPPFMHGAAHWNAFAGWLAGGTVVVPSDPTRLDPADVLGTCAAEAVSSLLIVGDAFARPLVDELRCHDYDLGALRYLITGGAILSPDRKRDLVELIPGLRIIDVLGASETGRQAVGSATGGTFTRESSALVLSEDRTRLLDPGDPEIGWLAQRGRVPRGYLGDPAKTAATFPEVEGERFAVPGDRARLLADGQLELHGRDSVTINTGGEKVYAEEVELAIKSHPAVYDALVVGRASARWGQEVVAVVALRPGEDPGDDALGAACEPTLARYKWPKAFVRVDRVERSPAGKPDYAWARSVAGSG